MGIRKVAANTDNTVFAASAPLRSPALEMAVDTAAAVGMFGRAGRAAAPTRPGDPDGQLANTRYFRRKIALYNY